MGDLELEWMAKKGKGSSQLGKKSTSEMQPISLMKQEIIFSLVNEW